MKSKLMMLIWVGALAFSASAPSAMAGSKTLSSSRPNRAVAQSAGASLTKKAAAKSAASAHVNHVSCSRDLCKAAIPPRAIVPGGDYDE